MLVSCVESRLLRKSLHCTRWGLQFGETATRERWDHDIGSCASIHGRGDSCKVYRLHASTWMQASTLTSFTSVRELQGFVHEEHVGAQPFCNDNLVQPLLKSDIVDNCAPRVMCHFMALSRWGFMSDQWGQRHCIASAKWRVNRSLMSAAFDSGLTPHTKEHHRTTPKQASPHNPRQLSTTSRTTNPHRTTNQHHTKRTIKSHNETSRNNKETKRPDTNTEQHQILNITKSKPNQM